MNGAAGLIGVGAAAVGVAALAGSGAPSPGSALGDGELWDLIASGGDVLSGDSLEHAAISDPRRIEALVTQRVVRPLLLVVLKVTRPWIELGTLDQMLKNSYIRRNEELRRDGGLTAETIGRSVCAGWRKSSTTLLSAGKSGTAEGDALRTLLLSNALDIERAFAESDEILTTAASVDPGGPHGWELLRSAIGNMRVVVRHLARSASTEAQDAEIWPEAQVAALQLPGPAGESPHHGLPDPHTDRFGAASLESVACDPDAYGSWEHEQYIVSGHRAPSVAIPEYRRMGGRVYGSEPSALRAEQSAVGSRQSARFAGEVRRKGC